MTDHWGDHWTQREYKMDNKRRWFSIPLTVWWLIAEIRTAIIISIYFLFLINMLVVQAYEIIFVFFSFLSLYL